MNTTHALAALALLAGLTTGCGTFAIQTPPKFLELEVDDDYSQYDYRATTADGVVLAVTKHEVEAERGSTVDFWVEAIEARLRHTGGYALTEKKAVSTSRGLAGMQLRFGHDQAQKPYLYWVTVFVSGDAVYVIEAGGAEDLFTAQVAQIEQSIASFTP